MNVQAEHLNSLGLDLSFALFLLVGPIFLSFAFGIGFVEVVVRFAEEAGVVISFGPQVVVLGSFAQIFALAILRLSKFVPIEVF